MRKHSGDTAVRFSDTELFDSDSSVFCLDQIIHTHISTSIHIRLQIPCLPSSKYFLHYYNIFQGRGPGAGRGGGEAAVGAERGRDRDAAERGRAARGGQELLLQRQAPPPAQSSASTSSLALQTRGQARGRQEEAEVLRIRRQAAAAAAGHGRRHHAEAEHLQQTVRLKNNHNSATAAGFRVAETIFGAEERIQNYDRHPGGCSGGRQQQKQLLSLQPTHGGRLTLAQEREEEVSAAETQTRILEGEL